MNRTIRIFLISLIGIGLLSGLLWRLEVEYWGWAGLIWVSYFHDAIPAGVLLFLLWVLAVARFILRFSAIALVRTFATLAAIATVFYHVAAYSFVILYGRGPDAAADIFFLVKFLGIHFMYTQIAARLLLFSLPAWLYLAARLLGFAVSWRNAIAAYAVYFAAVPASKLAIATFEPDIPADFIHTIKSGFIVPFLIASFGLCFVPLRSRFGSRGANP